MHKQSEPDCGDQTREVPTGERREPKALESLSSLPIYVGQPSLAL